MQKAILILVFITSLPSLFAQKLITQKLESISLEADEFIGEDKFGSIYFIQNNTLFKKSKTETVEYREIQLGKIFSVDLLNPLQITIFYKEANTAVIVDNRLNEVKRIAFDELSVNKMVDFCTTANDNSVWIFNADLQELEIYNYNAEESALRTLPVFDNVLGQKSNFNYCWLLSKDAIKQYNIYGSLIKEMDGSYDAIEVYKNQILLINQDGISYYGNHKEENLTPLEMPKIAYQQLHLNNEKLYIYDGNAIHIYQIISKN